MMLELLVPVTPLVPLAVPTLGARTATSTTALTVHWTNANSQATTELWRDGVLQGTAAKGATSMAQTGLTSGVTYSFKIRHLLSGVYSPFTASLNGYTVPAAPTGLAAQAIGNKVTVSWVNPNQELSTEVRSGSGSLLTTVGPTVATWDHTGLADATYVYKVRATDGTTTSAYTSTVSATVDTVVQPPTSLARTVVANQVQLSWTNNNGTDQIRVYRDGALITTQVATTTSYNDSSLANGTYAYVVRHYNGVTESANSNSVSATVSVSAYATPTGLSLSNAAYSDRVTVSWANGASQPTQIWRDGGSGYALAGTVAIGVTSYVDDGLTVTHGYSYKIRHFNSPDFSDYTAPASVTTATPTLTSLSVTNSWSLAKFTIGYTTAAMPYGGTVYFSGASDDTGLNAGYAAVAGIHADTNGAFAYDVAPSGFTITKYPNGPSSGTFTVSNLKIKNGAGTTLVTSSSFNCTFDYDSGMP
jgi:hypothetical protein